MNRPAKRSLSLNRETVRTLSSREMAHVAGGALVAAQLGVYNTRNCPTISNLSCQNCGVAGAGIVRTTNCH